MKRKNKIIFIILLILFLSIGFAVLSATTNINTNITFLPQSFNIYFENLQVNQESSNLDNPTLSNEDTSVSFITTINEPGDFYEFSFDVINAGTMDAALDEIIKSGLTSTQEEYLDYTARYYGERDINVDDILHAGYKERVVVRVEYKYNIDNVPSLGNISFSFGLNYIKRDLQKDYGEETWSIDYTGSEHTFTVPKTGIYRLETWGASGGSGYSYLENRNNSIGGYGGYSTGTIILNKNNNYYINVGGKGDDCSIEKSADEIHGGYNGGGYGYYNENTGFGAGGGATHIASSTGLLFDFYTKINQLTLVSGAGGGGGTNHIYINNGGSGGGYIGNDGEYTKNLLESTYIAHGGTQISAGTGQSEAYNASFGVGGQYNGSGGGAGLYGGASGRNAGASAGGGSGYIGNTDLTNKIMYCYNCQSSENEEDETHIKTRSTTNVSEEPISNYAKIGNGYARITYLGNYNTNQYTIINYHANGGQGSMDTQVITSTTALNENKYTREGYTFVGWSTTEKELNNYINSIGGVTGLTQPNTGEYSFDYNITPGDNYFNIYYQNPLSSNTTYSLAFNLKDFEDSKVVKYGYPTENDNAIRIKNGYNIIKYNTSSSTPGYGIFDDKAGEKDLTASGTFYNFFLYKDSDVNYFDKANVTFSNGVSTINLYALWAKVES